MKKKIMILSILIILSILLIIAIFLDKNKYMPNQAEINKVSISSVKKEIINNEDKKDDTKSSFEEKYQWQLSIPKIGLNAPIGDFIIYKNRNNIFKFKVTDKFETNENNVSILNESINTKITLITCITGKHSKRLIVVGEKVD